MASQECGSCRGSGRDWGETCTTCGGSGRTCGACGSMIIDDECVACDAKMEDD